MQSGPFEFIINQKTKSYKHTDFPSGPPPQYYPCLNSFNFGVQMGSGAFELVWPIALYRRVIQ
jgi:hypothetical protein